VELTHQERIEGKPDKSLQELFCIFHLTISIFFLRNYRVAKNVLPTGTAPTTNDFNIEFYTRRKLVKNGVRVSIGMPRLGFRNPRKDYPSVGFNSVVFILNDSI
jgi:hypothetical protein